MQIIKLKRMLVCFLRRYFTLVTAKKIYRVARQIYEADSTYQSKTFLLEYLERKNGQEMLINVHHCSVKRLPLIFHYCLIIFLSSFTIKIQL